MLTFIYRVDSLAKLFTSLENNKNEKNNTNFTSSNPFYIKCYSSFVSCNTKVKDSVGKKDYVIMSDSFYVNSCMTPPCNIEP